jgi:hypothetical protein
VCAEASIDLAHVDALLNFYGTDVIYGSTLYDVEAAQRSLDSNVSVGQLNSVQLTGQTAFDEVREILERLERPEDEFVERIHVVAASSMLSHGVDISRLNVMVMLGLPLTTAEFIQTTARVGRTLPGLVYVLHKIGRERDAVTFRHFHHFVTQGDRFVEPIPVTRRSRKVLELTLPGAMAARRLAIWEPQSADQRLTMITKLRDFVHGLGLTEDSESLGLAKALGFLGSMDELLRSDIQRWMHTWFSNLDDVASGKKFPHELSPTGDAMRSLRDVEEPAPIFD